MTVSFQLYSARNFTPWTGVYDRLAHHGYDRVEGFGPHLENAASTRAALDAAGLSMPSAHVALEALEGEFDATVEAASVLGLQSLYCPFIDPEARAGDRAGWEALAARLARIGEQLAAAGLRFGWHNHDFEFAALPDGNLPMDILLDSGPDLAWEADVAWIIRAGHDPLDWIARRGDRIAAAHVKDIAPEGANAEEDGWADLGHGTVDWATITAALRDAGCGLFVIEHDNPSDLDRFASRSIATYMTY